MAEVLQINRIESLDQYRLIWRLLAGQTRWPSYRHTLDWFEQYWANCDARSSPRVLVVRAADEVMGIVPLVLRRKSIGRRTFRVLQFPQDACGWTVGPIGPNPTATMMGAMRYLSAHRAAWKTLQLSITTVHPGMASRMQTSLAMSALPYRQQRSFAATLFELDRGLAFSKAGFRGKINDSQTMSAPHVVSSWAGAGKETVRLIDGNRVVAEGLVHRWLGGVIYQRFQFSHPCDDTRFQNDAISTLLDHHRIQGDGWAALPIENETSPNEWPSRRVEHATFTHINREPLVTKFGRLLTTNRLRMRRREQII